MRTHTSLVHRLIAALFGAVAMAACVDVTDPPLPPDAVAIAPPAQFALWWSLTEQCAGQAGDMRSVGWYVVPGVSSFDYDGQEVLGYWSAASNRIVLAERATERPHVVRHEMLHALLRNSTAGAHPRAAFGERCGGVVHCGPACAAEVASEPAAEQGTHVQLADVRTTAAAAPARVDHATAGWYAIVVRVHNDRDRAITVHVPGGTTPGTGLGYLIEHDGDVVQHDDVGGGAAVTLAPHETRMWVFDRNVTAGPGVLHAGTYALRGIAGADTLPASTLIVSP